MTTTIFQFDSFTISLESLLLTLILILLSVIILLLIKSKGSEYSVLTSSKMLQRRSDPFASRPRNVNLDLIRSQLLNNVEDDPSEKQESSEYELKVHEFNIKIKDQYANRRDLDPFKVLQDMKELQIAPDVTTFNTLIDICFTKHYHELAFKLFEHLKSLDSEDQPDAKDKKEKAPRPDVITYNTIIKGLSRQLNDKKQTQENKVILNKIFKMMKEITSAGLKPNEITYNSVLDACVKVHNLDLAFEYFDKMKSDGIQPDNFTYSTIIKGIKNQHSNNFPEFRHSHDADAIEGTGDKPEHLTIEKGPPGLSSKQTYNLDKVFEILTDVKQDYYFKPDEILFNCVIDACVKFHNLPKALEVFNEMTNIGLKPSGNTYSVLFKGFGNAKQFDNMMKMYKRMLADQTKMNEVTYGCLIDACIKCHRLDQAMEFFKLMKHEQNMKINSVIYSILIKGFTSSRNFDQAFEVFRDMQSSPDVQMNIITYNSMLECAIKCNKASRFFEVYDMAITRGGKVQPDLITYSTYIKGLCKFGQVDKALNMYNHLRKEKTFRMDEVLFNSLLHGLHKAREFEKAIEVYNDMPEYGVKPSHVTYSILIKIYADQNKIDEALDLFEEIKKVSTPGLILYTCIIQVCIKSKKINKIMQTYKDMRKNRVRGKL